MSRLEEVFSVHQAVLIKKLGCMEILLRRSTISDLNYDHRLCQSQEVHVGWVIMSSNQGIIGCGSFIPHLDTISFGVCAGWASQ
jgi:hypothetical protein